MNPSDEHEDIEHEWNTEYDPAVRYVWFFFVFYFLLHSVFVGYFTKACRKNRSEEFVSPN